VRSEGFYINEKISMTPAGFEPATFRFVAQRLNHCATAHDTSEVLHFQCFNYNLSVKNA